MFCPESVTSVTIDLVADLVTLLLGCGAGAPGSRHTGSRHSMIVVAYAQKPTRSSQTAARQP
jgi:hypothetical protein